MYHRFLTLAVLVATLVFGVVTLAVIKDILRPSDFKLTVKLQDKFPARFDDNIVLLVDLGSMEVQGFLFLLALALLPLQARTKIGIVALYGLGLAVVLLGKHVIPQPAPPYMFQRGDQGLAFPSMHVQVESSYPSGHTYRVIFLTSLLLFTWISTGMKKYFALLCGIGSALLALMVMIGLVVLGKHWLTDLIGGGSLAILLAGMIFVVLPEHKQTPADTE